jgi:hypothetical protein
MQHRQNIVENLLEFIDDTGQINGQGAYRGILHSGRIASG